MGSEQGHVARNHFLKQTDGLKLYFWHQALIDVISKPLMELPSNFKIGYADEDPCSANVASIIAWGITITINIGVTIGITAGIINGTIEQLNPCQSLVKHKASGPIYHFSQVTGIICQSPYAGNISTTLKIQFNTCAARCKEQM